jgi:hypothetical protein
VKAGPPALDSRAGTSPMKGRRCKIIRIGEL